MLPFSDEKAKLVKQNLYEQIADYLEQMIVSDTQMAKEERLPSEQLLAEHFGVSRNVIRESLKLLKERGLITQKNGTGTYITRPEASNISNVVTRIVAMNQIGYKDIYDVRIILETAACRKAATNATNEQLQAMKELLERLKNREISVKERRELDFDFHIAIAEAAGNPLLVMLVQTMRDVFIEHIEKGIFLEGGIEDAITRHGRIMTALNNRNPDEAEAMMYDHLHFSEMNVERYSKNNM